MVEVLTALGLTRYDVVSYVSHGVSKDGADDAAMETAGSEDDDEDGEGEGDAEKVSDPLSKFAINLNESAAAGHIEPLVGREKELRRAIQVLCRRRKNNPIFVGDAGVSKTAIVEGLAAKIVAGEVPKDGRTPTEDQLKAELRKTLSSYKVPKHIVMLEPDEVLWTPSNKVRLNDMMGVIAARIGKVAVSA